MENVKQHWGQVNKKEGTKNITSEEEEKEEEEEEEGRKWEWSKWSTKQKAEEVLLLVGLTIGFGGGVYLLYRSLVLVPSVVMTIISCMLITIFLPLMDPAILRYTPWHRGWIKSIDYKSMVSVNAAVIAGTLIFLTLSDSGTNIAIVGLFGLHPFVIPTRSLINALAALTIIPFSVSSLTFLLWGPHVREPVKDHYHTTKKGIETTGGALDHEGKPLTPQVHPGLRMGTIYMMAGFGWIILSMGMFVIITTTPNVPTFTSLPTTFEVDATDENGANVRYPIPTAVDSEGSKNNTVICKPRSGDKFPVGETTVECTATDKEGGKGTGNFIVVVMDDPPDTIIKHVIIGDGNNTDVVNSTVVPYTSSNSIYFTFEGQDKFGTKYYECRRYTQENKTAPFLPCEGPQFHSYSNLTPGVHTFQVRAIDATPQRDITPARFTWVITNSSQSNSKM